MKKLIKYISIFFMMLVFIMESLIVSFPYNEPKYSDAILILGSQIENSRPKDMLRYRLDKGFELYKMGYGKYIIVTGGQGKNENMPEGNVMKNYLIENGIDKDKVLVENKSKNTYENFKYSKDIIDKKGFEEIVVVSSRFHLLRASITSKKFNLKTSFSGSKIDYEDMWNYLREIPAVFKYIVKY